MARGVNKIILVGNLGNDPEVRYGANNSAVATVSLATSDAWRDKQTGETQERTEWHRIVFFGRLAEVARDYLRKGSKIYVEGSIHTRKWQDKSGQDRYTTEVEARDMQMLDSKSSSAAAAMEEQYGDGGRSSAIGSAGAAVVSSKAKADSLPPAADVDDGFDGDIPF